MREDVFHPFRGGWREASRKARPLRRGDERHGACHDWHKDDGPGALLDLAACGLQIPRWPISAPGGNLRGPKIFMGPDTGNLLPSRCANPLPSAVEDPRKTEKSSRAEQQGEILLASAWPTQDASLRNNFFIGRFSRAGSALIKCS